MQESITTKTWSGLRGHYQKLWAPVLSRVADRASMGVERMSAEVSKWVGTGLAIALLGSAGCTSVLARPPSPTEGTPARSEVSPPPPAVRVTTDKLSYRRGEPILVTIRNDLSTAIYVPIDQTHCSVVSLQRREAGRWETREPCTAEGPTLFIAIAPNGEMQGAAGRAAEGSRIESPVVSEPSRPGVFEGDVRKLPPVEPWKPGDPIREVPKRGDPPEGQFPPFSTVRGEIASGTYRIELRFRLAASLGPERTIYSKEFVVLD